MPLFWTDPFTGVKYEQGDPALIGCGNPPTAPANVGEGRVPFVPTNDGTGALDKGRPANDPDNPWNAKQGGFRAQRGKVPPNVRNRPQGPPPPETPV